MRHSRLLFLFGILFASVVSAAETAAKQSDGPAVLVERADGKEILLVGSKDGMLYGLDPDNNGKVMWQIRLGKDGELRAYDTASGEPVWTFDTVRDYETANGRKGFGGSLGSFGGPVIVKNRLYVSSGMDTFNIGMPGNVLLVFEIPE